MSSSKKVGVAEQILKQKIQALKKVQPETEIENTAIERQRMERFC